MKHVFDYVHSDVCGRIYRPSEMESVRRRGQRMSKWVDCCHGGSALRYEIREYCHGLQDNVYQSVMVMIRMDNHSSSDVGLSIRNILGQVRICVIL